VVDFACVVHDVLNLAWAPGWVEGRGAKRSFKIAAMRNSPSRRWRCGTRAIACAIGATLSLTTTGSAQVTVRSTANEVGDVFQDVAYFWASPLRADTRDWANAGLVASGLAALLPLDAPVDRWIVRHQRTGVVLATTPFREQGGPFSRLATARRLIPISAALVVAGSLTDHRALREAGYGCIAAWGASNTVRYTLYATVSRLRPSAAGGDAFRIRVPGGKWDENSFFAGHATNAFACASFWSERFDLSAGEPVLYAAAALTALARMADRRHWTSDTFVGVAVGLAIGHTIAARYERRAARRAASSLDGTARPAMGRALAPPVVILWRATF
jgi:membrane-associated phospholipid phosphatase